MDDYTRNLWLFFILVLGYLIYSKAKEFKLKNIISGKDGKGGAF